MSNTDTSTDPQSNLVTAQSADPLDINAVNFALNVMDVPRNVDGGLGASLGVVNDTDIHSYTELMSRPFTIQHFDWTATTGDFAIPLVNIPGTATFAEFIKVMAYVRSDLVLTFKVIGSPFHKGLLFIAWNPNSAATDDLLTTAVAAQTSGPNVTAYSTTQVSSLPHVTIQPCQSSTVTLRIPWASVFSMAMKNQFEYNVSAGGLTSQDYAGMFGSLIFHFPSPLEFPPDTTNSVGVSVWGSFPSDSIKIAGYTDPVANTVYDVGAADYNAHLANQLSQDSIVQHRMAAPIQGGCHFDGYEPQMDNRKEGMDKSKQVSSSMSNPLSVLTDTFSSVMSAAAPVADVLTPLLGFLDKPDNPVDPGAMIRRTDTNFAAGNGLTESHTLALNQGMTHVPTEFWEPHDIAQLKKIPSVFRKFTIPPTAGQGTLLDSMYVGPAFCIEDGSLLPALGAFPSVKEIIPSWVAFCSYPFTNWCGAMKYKFQFIKNNFQKFSVVVQWIPDMYNKNLTGSMLDANVSRLWTWFFEVSDVTEFVIEIPYLGGFGQKEIAKPCNWNLSGTANPTSWLNGPITNYSGFPNCANGALQVFVQNRLSNPSSAPLSADCYIWAAGSDSMHYSCPDGYGLNSIVRTGVNWARDATPGPALGLTPVLEKDFAAIEKIDSKLQSDVQVLENDRSDMQQAIAKFKNDDKKNLGKKSVHLHGYKEQMDAGLDAGGVTTREDMMGVSKVDAPSFDCDPMKLYGEAHDNLAPLLRRSQLLQRSAVNMSADQVSAHHLINIPITPSMMGIVAPSIGSFTSQDAAKHSTLLSYFSSCFAFWRGALRYQLVVELDNIDVNPLLKASLVPYKQAYSTMPNMPTEQWRGFNGGGGQSYDALNPPTAFSASSFVNTSTWPQSWSSFADMMSIYGVGLEQFHQQGVLSVVAPYFRPSYCASTQSGPVAMLDTKQGSATVDAYYGTGISGNLFFDVSRVSKGKENNMQYSVYVSAGDGFQLGLPRCPPRLYFRNRGVVP